MTTYKCLIVDDNEIERDAIEMFVRKIGRLEIVAVCASSIEVASVLAKQQVDIIFSDIDMPELSGINLVKSLKNIPAVIFITSYGAYAVESFEVDAIDFIVKPATFERIFKASNKAIDYLDLKKEAKKSKKAEQPEPNGDDYFFIKETKGYTRLTFDEVIYMESMGDFSKIYTTQNMYITLVNLKNLERQLPNNFVRIHKQYIINTNKIV
ncbi:MAG: response regulator transcription factor, partial [Chitinophagaceae bacterium]